MPQRFLRPGLTTSQRWNSCTWSAQSLFARLITLVDDYGRYDAEPRLLRSHAFPFGDPVGREIKLTTLANMCEQLSTNGLAIFYLDGDGKKCVQLLRWQERPRAEKSKYSPFDNSCVQLFATDSKCSPPSSSSSSSSSIRRHSTNGSQKPSAQTDQEWISELTQTDAYRGIDVAREFSKMIQWCKARKGRQPTRRRFLNWLNRVERPINFKTSPRLDPRSITLPPEFREWAAKAYPKQANAITAMKTWADVSPWMREEWKRKKLNPLVEIIPDEA